MDSNSGKNNNKNVENDDPDKLKRNSSLPASSSSATPKNLHSRSSSINHNLTEDALLVGTALDQLLDNLDTGKHLMSPTQTSPITNNMTISNADMTAIPKRQQSLESLEQKVPGFFNL
jgi:hypothetical protein